MLDGQSTSSTSKPAKMVKHSTQFWNQQSGMLLEHRNKHINNRHNDINNNWTIQSHYMIHIIISTYVKKEQFHPVEACPIIHYAT